MIPHFEQKRNTKNGSPSDPLSTLFLGLVNRKQILRTLREGVMLL